MSLFLALARLWLAVAPAELAKAGAPGLAAIQPAALSAHILVAPQADCHAARRRLDAMLTERFGLTHTTLQVEHAKSPAVQLGTAHARRTPLQRR